MRFLLGLLIISTSCYSFKGISIDPEIKYFSIENIEDQSGSAPANYPIDFELALSNKIRRESRLILNKKKPDLKFKCTVSQYNVASTAPVEGRANAINRLTVTLNVECLNLLNEKNNWTKSFSRYEDFDANQSLSEVQFKLLEKINKLLLDDIFNAAFSNW